jgi:predicted HicB family RNase H-like nuclease
LATSPEVTANQSDSVSTKEGAVMSQAMQIPESAIHDSTDSHQLETRSQTLLRSAEERYHKAADWVAFFREVLGIDGIVRKMFVRPEELDVFERSREYAQIQQMLAKLRERNDELNAETEPTRVITVRMPKSLHESLKKEAHIRQTSMNKLCISKLLQMIDNGLVPSD